MFALLFEAYRFEVTSCIVICRLRVIANEFDTDVRERSWNQYMRAQKIAIVRCMCYKAHVLQFTAQGTLRQCQSVNISSLHMDARMQCKRDSLPHSSELTISHGTTSRCNYAAGCKLSRFFRFLVVSFDFELMLCVFLRFPFKRFALLLQAVVTRTSSVASGLGLTEDFVAVPLSSLLARTLLFAVAWFASFCEAVTSSGSSRLLLCSATSVTVSLCCTSTCFQYCSCPASVVNFVSFSNNLYTVACLHRSAKYRNKNRSFVQHQHQFLQLTW